MSRKATSEGIEFCETTTKLVDRYFKTVHNKCVTKFGGETLYAIEQEAGVLDLNHTLITAFKERNYLYLGMLMDGEMAVPVIRECERQYAELLRFNFIFLETLGKIAVHLRPGQPWREKLETVDMGGVVDKWLKLWDEKKPTLEYMQVKVIEHIQDTSRP